VLYDTEELYGKVNASRTITLAREEKTRVSASN
jgi:hypothetical protein